MTLLWFTNVTETGRFCRYWAESLSRRFALWSCHWSESQSLIMMLGGHQVCLRSCTMTPTPHLPEQHAGASWLTDWSLSRSLERHRVLGRRRAGRGRRGEHAGREYPYTCISICPHTYIQLKTDFVLLLLLLCCCFCVTFVVNPSKIRP